MQEIRVNRAVPDGASGSICEGGKAADSDSVERTPAGAICGSAEADWSCQERTCRRTLLQTRGWSLPRCSGASGLLRAAWRRGTAAFAPARAEAQECPGISPVLCVCALRRTNPKTLPFFLPYCLYQTASLAGSWTTVRPFCSQVLG